MKTDDFSFSRSSTVIKAGLLAVSYTVDPALQFKFRFQICNPQLLPNDADQQR